jgi:hypothetical protein
MGANHITMVCKLLVVKEHIQPIIQSNAIASSTVWVAVLRTRQRPPFPPWGSGEIKTYGEKEYLSPSNWECMLAVASNIWLMLYANELTPAACPRKLHQPTIHDQMGTCRSGTTCLVTKYIPPAVGYADTSSETF